MYIQLDGFTSAQYKYDNILPDENEQTQEEALSIMPFSQKWNLAQTHIDSTDKDLRTAITQDLFNSYSLKDIIDLLRKNKNTEKYLDDVLLDSKLI